MTQKFKELVNEINSDFERFWDFDKKEMMVSEVDSAHEYLNSTECQELYFLANVWLGTNEYAFDFIYSSLKLGQHSRYIIGEWMLNPFTIANKS